MRDAPEQEKNTGRTHQGTHDIHHHGHFRGVACKLTEQIGGKHKEGGTGRVTYFQFIPSRNKFGTIPKTGSRFDGHAVSERCNDEGKPSYQIVDLVVLLFHVIILFLVNFQLKYAQR